MLNIALISEHASPIAPLGGVDSGGQNVYVAHVARQLAALGHGVDIYTRCDSPLQQRVMEWGAGIRIVNVPAGPARFLPKEALLPYMDEFSRFMIDFARDENLEYDVVHANFFMSGMVAREFKLATGTPFVITFHALGKVRRMNQGQDDGFLDERFEIEEMLMREAARVIAECEQDSLDMQTLYGADRRRIDVVPCGFDPEELWPVSSGARLKLGLPENEFIILQLGRIVRRKGIDNVIRAAGELRRRHGIASRLLVVGGNSPIPDLAGTPEFARLVAVAEEAGVRQNVSFVGQRPRTELRYFYSAADVFVTTPWYEPFGITPVEAMACDTAVIGSAVGGIKTTVLDGRTGYLVPPDDPAALADRLAKLHRDPALACRLASAGMHRAYRYFTWRKVTAQLATIYRAVLKGKPARRAVPAVVGAGVPLASRI